MAAALAGAAAGPARAGIDPDRDRPLPWRSEGRLLFVVDLAPGPGPDHRTRTDVALRIPGDQLKYMDRGDSLVAQVQITIEFRTRFGKAERTDRRTVTLTSPPKTASGYSPGHLLLESYNIPPGAHQVRVHIEDLQQPKKGLAYVGRRVPEKGVAEGRTTIPAFPEEGLVVSPPLLSWPSSALDAPDSARTAFVRIPGGAPVLPNPDRTYGLYAPIARGYFEVRPARGGGSERDTVVARVRSLDGGLVAVLDSTVLDEDGPWAGRLGFDVSTLPAGAYDLQVEIRGPGGRAVGTNRFNIAWRRESWERDPREFLEEAHFLLDDPDQELRYSEATAGEQEAWLDRYWKDLDPTPLTAQNEARDRFRARVQYANDHFSIEGVVKGMLSDRGRIYLRFGEPDDIRLQVIPTGDHSLQNIAAEIANEDDPAYIQLRKPGGLGADERPFEVWTYNRATEPVEERAKHGSQRLLSRKFVFVDEQGYGNFTLKYSSE
jgi:GWxTD domain-containing protein